MCAVCRYTATKIHAPAQIFWGLLVLFCTLIVRLRLTMLFLITEGGLERKWTWKIVPEHWPEWCQEGSIVIDEVRTRTLPNFYNIFIIELVSTFLQEWQSTNVHLAGSRLRPTAVDVASRGPSGRFRSTESIICKSKRQRNSLSTVRSPRRVYVRLYKPNIYSVRAGANHKTQKASKSRISWTTSNWSITSLHNLEALTLTHHCLLRDKKTSKWKNSRLFFCRPSRENTKTRLYTYINQVISIKMAFLRCPLKFWEFYTGVFTPNMNRTFKGIEFRPYTQSENFQG